MPYRYDVVVVGARCAGATLAVHLARAGLSVALVDRAEFPSDTLSTHFIETPGIEALDRLGVLRDATSDAPFIRRSDLRIDDFAALQPYGPGRAALAVRRSVLDALLVDAAGNAGVDVMTGCRVTGLVEDAGRAAGVTAINPAGGDVRLDAILVVGADGTGSTVARMVGARRYHALHNQRFCSWGYFDGTAAGRESTVLYHFLGGEVTVGFPCDAGLYAALVLPPLHRLGAFRANLDEAFAAAVAADDDLAAALEGGRRVGPLRGVASYPLFFRESAGPGWVLVGDAGHFKDPIGAQGMSDAFRQAERLADDIVAAFGGGTGSLDDSLTAWWTWRDDDALELHWYSADLGAAGPVPAVVAETLRHMASEPDGLVPFLDVFHHRCRPSDVFTEERLVASAGRLADAGLGPQAEFELAARRALAAERSAVAAAPVFDDEGRPRRVAPSSVG